MNFLKRAAWGLWRHKFKNILLVVVFAAIFAVTLISFMVYSATSHQVEVTQKAVANAVTMQGPLVNGSTASSALNIGWSAADSFVKSDYIERYNIVMTNVDMDVLDALPVLQSEEDRERYQTFQDVINESGDLTGMWDWYFDIEKMSSYYEAHANEENPGFQMEFVADAETQGFYYDMYNPNYSREENEYFSRVYNTVYGSIDGQPIPEGFRVTAISDSEYFDNFSSGGYALVEGQHFKREEEHSNYALISRQVAEENGLQVGDTVSLQFGPMSRMVATFSNPHPWKLTVRGIFEPPDTEFSASGFSASNFVYVPYEAMFDYCMDQYNNDALLWFPAINRVTAYMNTPADVDAFVEELYDKFNIVEIAGDNSPPTGTNIEDLLDEGTFDSGDPEKVDQKFSQFVVGSFSLNPWYVLMVDRGWYEMVAAPLEDVNLLTLVMGVGLLAGAFVVLLLICVFNVRKRKKELGILLSMGEPKGKLFLQMLVEQAVPLILAAVVGFGVGVPFAATFGNDLLSGKASEVNEVYDQDKREYLDAQLEGNSYDIEQTQTIRSAANIVAPMKLKFQLDSRMTALYFAGTFLLLFVTVLVQMVFLLRLSPARILARRN